MSLWEVPSCDENVLTFGRMNLEALNEMPTMGLSSIKLPTQGHLDGGGGHAMSHMGTVVEHL